MIALVDYGAGNLENVRRGLRRLGRPCDVFPRPEGLEGASLILLPGVGAFGPAVAALRETGWFDALIAWAGAGRPLLGICLGMQLLCQGSREDGDHRGLGLLEGTVEPLGTARCPHMGWNRAVWTRDLPPLGRAGEEAGCFYFVHGYALPQGPDILGVCTEEDLTFTALAGRGPVMGCQFHPERSGSEGARLLGGLLDLLEARS